MMAYPGYTVDKIRAELSIRQIEKLLETWDNYKPDRTYLHRIDQMIQRHTGISFVDKKIDKKESDDKTRNRIANFMQFVGS